MDAEIALGPRKPWASPWARSAGSGAGHTATRQGPRPPGPSRGTDLVGQRGWNWRAEKGVVKWGPVPGLQSHPTVVFCSRHILGPLKSAQRQSCPGGKHRLQAARVRGVKSQPSRCSKAMGLPAQGKLPLQASPPLWPDKNGHDEITQLRHGRMVVDTIQRGLRAESARAWLECGRGVVRDGDPILAVVPGHGLPEPPNSLPRWQLCALEPRDIVNFPGRNGRSSGQQRAAKGPESGSFPGWQAMACCTCWAGITRRRPRPAAMPCRQDSCSAVRTERQMWRENKNDVGCDARPETGPHDNTFSSAKSQPLWPNEIPSTGTGPADGSPGGVGRDCP